MQDSIRNIELLYTVLRRIGYTEFQLSDDNHGKFQKSVYLLQNFYTPSHHHLSLGVGFYWMQRGVYSPGLHDLLQDVEYYQTDLAERYDPECDLCIWFGEHSDMVRDILAEYTTVIGDRCHDRTFLDMLSAAIYLHKSSYSFERNSRMLDTHEKVRQAIGKAMPWSYRYPETVDAAVEVAFTAFFKQDADDEASTWLLNMVRFDILS